MKRSIIFPLLSLCMVAPACAQAPSDLVGTWNVTSTPTGETSFDGQAKAGSFAYIWIISTSPDGEILVSVQGETSFPKLRGRWNPVSRTIILKAHSVGLGGNSACWFRLSFNERGVMRGVRRFMDSTPAFIDFEIVAKHS